MVCCIFYAILEKWLLLNKAYTLKDNFITSDAYICIELNAHAIVIFLLAVRDHMSKVMIAFYPGFLDLNAVKHCLGQQGAYVVYFLPQLILACLVCCAEYIAYTFN